MTEDEVKLLPCPFCGREPISTDHGALVFHQIAPCPLSKQHFDVRIWNTRAIEATRPPIGTDEVVERVARARQLARDNPSLKGWRVSDSHFFPWLSEHMGPENIEYLRLIVRNADTIARTLAAMKDAASD